MSLQKIDKIMLDLSQKNDNKPKFIAYHKNNVCQRPPRIRESVYVKAVNKKNKIMLNKTRFIKKT